jgi:dolichol-phosphate mannosyltransferase
VELSVVAPCFNEAAGLEQFIKEIQKSLELNYQIFELILVDDGSKDLTWQTIQKLKKSYPFVKGVKLTRNFGHQLAVMAGLSLASGELIAIIDADLQDPPSLIPIMAAQITNQIQIVYGQRESRSGESAFKKISAMAFYRLINLLTLINIPVDTGDFRVITKKVCDELLKIQDNRPFLRGYFAFLGFESMPFTYSRNARFAGKSNYPLRKMLQFGLSAFLAFSSAPFNILLYFGVLLILAPIILVAFLLFFAGVDNHILLMSLAVAIIVETQGLILCALFLMGKYLESIHFLSKRMPTYLISIIEA